MSASAGTEALTTTEIVLFNGPTDGGNCTTFYVINFESGGAGNALIHVPGLHKSGEFFPVPPGLSVPFRLNHNGIAKVIAKSSTGTVNIGYGVTAKIENL